MVIATHDFRMPDTDICPQCGKRFKKLATHHQVSSTCKLMAFPDGLIEVMRGVAATRGDFHKGGSENNAFEFGVRSNDIAQGFESVLGAFGCSVRDVGDNNSYYFVSTIHHPDVSEVTFRPSSGRISPLSLKSMCKVSDYKNTGYIKSRKDISFELADHVPFLQGAKHVEVRNEEWAYLEPTNSQKFDEMIDVKWPRGWWNRRYLD